MMVILKKADVYVGLPDPEKQETKKQKELGSKIVIAKKLAVVKKHKSIGSSRIFLPIEQANIKLYAAEYRNTS